jgi:hypothetical protein
LNLYIPMMHMLNGQKIIKFKNFMPRAGLEPATSRFPISSSAGRSPN